MNYEETIEEIDSTLGMVLGFMKNTPKDTLPQMWPLFKKYQIGESQTCLNTVHNNIFHVKYV